MFFALNWTRWKKWMFIGLAGVIIYLSFHLSSSYVLNPNVEGQASGGIIKSLKDEKEISITINVAWGDDVIIDILEVLKEEKVKATFFVNGEWALRNEEIAKLIIEENHEVGLLGFYQDHYEDLTFDEITEDIKNGESTLERLNYEPLTLVRPPENKYNESVVNHINDLGYRTVFWSHFANIKQSTDPKQKGGNISNQMSNGDIILFKAQDNLTATPEVIKHLIEQKRQDGYKFVTITELLSPAKIKLNPLN
ncbi:polysaccharide deacetylase family protein [Aquisalibacillus elongatus]|uniref:Peptidoglycan/xylan/chitin deacetylase (PgdA/CDA1 family) n=1 Tax=Aquisalibacillus elongatus TaxID=485577 RepID=A0A3N5AYK0_9BACI|nr:polysaccharide deacetylase family protein [Aquisalibacillus elongatus]RPF50047.1 peptidoglycan/xylan/chitin deacetylase (PgdA/CDA1 family) [Aquisalibacillus elongatus]